ncbi:MAG TPA: hypothetical protein VGV93_05145 [Acidimicrobiales bacterium]|nr:hypothetical protein [Acidimicrobiales bacterium]
MVHRLAIVPVDEVLAALRGAGFQHVMSYKNWASTAPEPPDGSRIIAVGCRAAGKTMAPGETGR